MVFAWKLPGTLLAVFTAATTSFDVLFCISTIGLYDRCLAVTIFVGLAGIIRLIAALLLERHQMPPPTAAHVFFISLNIIGCWRVASSSDKFSKGFVGHVASCPPQCVEISAPTCHHSGKFFNSCFRFASCRRLYALLR
jgi:hypothetical protein